MATAGHPSASVKPIKNAFDSRHGLAFRQVGAVNHHDRQAKRPRRMQLGFGASPARVLADHDVDGMLFEQRSVSFHRERATRDNNGMARQGRGRFWRIHQPQDIVMLGLSGELFHMQPTQGQHHTFARTFERRNCARHICHMNPIVALVGLPRRTGQRQERHTLSGTGMKRIPAHLRGKRVCGVNDMGDVMVSDVRGQTVHAAKAPYPMRDRLRARVVDASRIGKGRLNTAIGQGTRKRAGFGCTAKNKEVGAHV